MSIHTVTAFIYAGLPGRGFWLTAIMAPRFLASAFAGGPALLILLALIVRKFTKFDPGKDAIQSLAKIVAYAMATNVFFILLELFTVFYSQLPEHMHHFEYIFAGLEGHGKLVPWMWTSSILAVVALGLLIPPATRKREAVLALACVVTFASLWIEKGMSLVIAGFIPSPLGKVFEYAPTGPEISITLAIWAMGFFVLTVLYKVAITVKEEVGS